MHPNEYFYSCNKCCGSTTQFSIKWKLDHKRLFFNRLSAREVGVNSFQESGIDG